MYLHCFGITLSLRLSICRACQRPRHYTCVHCVRVNHLEQPSCDRNWSEEGVDLCRYSDYLLVHQRFMHGKQSHLPG